MDWITQKGRVQNCSNESEDGEVGEGKYRIPYLHFIFIYSPGGEKDQYKKRK